MNFKGVDRSHVGVIIQDVKNLISENPDVSFVHVSRQCNEAANLLAKTSVQFNMKLGCMSLRR